jgi:hypothetical protein
MSGIGKSEQEVQVALQAYRDQIAQIVPLLPPGRGYFVRGAGERVREAAKNLKAAVKSDYKRPAHLRRSMSQVEIEVFEPCMQKVFVALQNLNLGTNPGPPWLHALYDADLELDYSLSHLEPK